MDSTASENMSLTEVIPGPGDVTTVFNKNDTMMTMDSDKSDMSIDRSLLDSQVVHNLSVMEQLHHRPGQISSARSLNVTVDSPDPAEFTMLQNDILRNVQDQEPVRSRRQSPRLAKRNSGEVSVKVSNKKPKSRGASATFNDSDSLNHSLPASNKKLKSGDKENMAAPVRSVSESFNRSLPTATPQVIQKMIITPRQSNAKRGRKKKSSDDNQAVNQSLDQTANNASSRTSLRKKPAPVDHNPISTNKSSDISRKSSIKSDHCSNQSMLLNSVDNITLLDVTTPIVSTSLSQQRQNSHLLHNESDIELLEPSLTHREIVREVGNEMGEDAMMIELEVKIQQLELRKEALVAEKERLNLEQKRKELASLPDEHALAIFKAIYGDAWSA